jgi:branched-chain amino acid transport system permease protein
MPTYGKRILGIAVTVLVLIGANAFMGRVGLFGFGLPFYYTEILNLTGISIILAVSLNLITGFTGQFSIGHAGFMAVGAYSSVYLSVYYTHSVEQYLTSIVGAAVAQSLVFLGVIVFGALVAAFAGLVVGVPSLRLRGDYLAIVTLGFAEIIRIIILNIDRVGGATGFRGRVPPWDGRLIIPEYANFIWIAGFAVITIVVVYNIVHSDIGRALISIREDELAAEAMGINSTRYKVLAFVISSSFAGIAGVLFGHFRQFLHTNDFQFIRSIEIIIMIVLGGMGSITGSVLGAIVITILPELLRKLPAFYIPIINLRLDLYGYRLVIYSLLLILIMLTRPQGVMGSKEFGVPWLKRAQRRPEGDKPVGEKGVPIAQESSSPLDQAKKIENR